MGTAAKRSFVLMIIAALKSFCVFFSQHCYAGGASPVCFASMQEQIKSDTACCCLSSVPQTCSLSDIVSFSVPLLQCSYSFSCALIVSHCAALSLSHSASLSLSPSVSLMISGSGVLMRLDSIWRQVARNSEDLPHTETLFLSPGLLPLLGYTQGSLFCSRRSRKTSSIFTFSPFHLFQPFKMSWRH